MGSSKLLKVGHHIKFDILMLKAEGIEVKGSVMCTMLGIEVLKAGATRQASLQFTAQDLLNISLDKTEQNSDWSGKLSKTQLQYAANDAGILIEILTQLQQKLDEAGLTKIAILEYCCLLPITEMQSRGIYLDRDRWRQVRKEYEQHRDRLADKIYQELDREFNIVSSSQLLKALQTYGIEIKSTNSNVPIEQVKKHPVIAEIIRYRSLNTILNTFLKGFDTKSDW